MKSKPMKSTIFVLAILTGAGIQTFGQDTQHKTEQTPGQSSEPVFMVVEKQPEFPGGKFERSKFFAQNLNIPKIAKKSRRVLVSFIVNTDGSLQDVVIAKGLSPEYDKEVLRVAQSMPNWIPGSQSGKLIRVKYILPVEF
ncbi:energy transducer TonB [Dyadobacter sp. MSC1_007]|jgi:protein TonB|uniref:energy transducer TonB n=1 Tax=Dyadobacter sp. MSC1_007 TaxID=2909264 RepID=UPI00203021CE|nr:energy transducer TonB [Dyadobacter sp. MSC1_007]